MKANSLRTLLFLFILSYFGYAISGTTPSEESPSEESVSAEGDTATEGDEATEEDMTPGDDVLTGDIEAGEARYNKTCKNCHGSAGKGAASYPKISGNEIAYTTEKLEAYRDGIKVGPNSSLMIMMAKPLTDEEIANLAAYLKEATPQ